MKKVGFTAFALTWMSAISQAQDKIVIDKEETASWFQDNWMWVVGAIVLIILIAALSGSSRSKRKVVTTTTQDDYGNVRKVTTEETEL